MKTIKYLLSTLLLLTVLSMTVTAQPVMWKQFPVTMADVAGNDTIKTFRPTPMGETLVKLTVTDSVHINIRNLGQYHTGDKLTFLITNTSGAGYFRLVGTWYQVTGADSAITLTSSKRATYSMAWDGTYWVETGKIVQ